jgi:Bacterial Ig-like domain (group 2)/Carbohydrate binding domain
MTHFLRRLAKLPVLILIIIGSAAYNVSAGNKGETGNAAVSGTDIQNPEFDNGTANWTLSDNTGPNYSNGGSSFSVVQGAGLSGTNSLYIDVINANNGDWTLGVKQQLNFNFEVGKTYRISFMAKGQSARNMDVAISGNGSNLNYWYQDLSMTASAQTFSFDFECTNTDVSNEPSFTLAFYLAKGVISDVWLDKVSIEDITGHVLGVQVDPSNLVLSSGQSWQLTKDIIPGDALNQDVSWTSNNTSIATVSSSGLVTAVSPGLCVITATTLDGGFTSPAVVVGDPSSK